MYIEHIKAPKVHMIVNTWHIQQIFVDKAREMVKGLVAKPEDLSFIPGTHTKKGKN